MTFTVETASTPVDQTGQRPVAPGHEVRPAVRGRTTIARGAVEAIVGRVAVETPGVAAAELRGIRGWLATRRPEVAEADLDGAGDGLHIQLGVAIDYPQPVADVVREVRRRITAHLRELLDLDVGQLDIRVTELRPTRAPVPVERRVR
jgi:uncharacterized alkaline shock family protein YloU